MNFKGKFVFFIILSFLFYSELIYSQQAINDDLLPFGLTVETIRNPQFTKIIDSKPEFSWVVPQKAVFQNAYQVLVSSEKKKIE